MVFIRHRKEKGEIEIGGLDHRLTQQALSIGNETPYWSLDCYVQTHTNSAKPQNSHGIQFVFLFLSFDLDLISSSQTVIPKKAVSTRNKGV